MADNHNQAVPPPAAAQAQPPPAMAQAAPPAQIAAPPPQAANTIPILKNPHLSLTFGRMDSDYTVIDHPVQIANQDTLSGETYDQLQAISSIDLNMNRENFIRMWKTLILKRTQDIYEIEKNIRSDHFIRLTRTISLPAPLGDLLATLGSFHSSATGHFHHVTPPPRPAEPETFWTVDNQIVISWNMLMARMQNLYLMKEFPSPREVDNRPITLIRRNFTANAQMLQLKANTNEAKLIDGFIVAVNDELFPDLGMFTLANAALTVTPRFHVPSVRGAYIGAYVLDSNA